MRIDLPGCNLNTCRHYCDYNCTKKEKYEECPYAILQKFAYTDLGKQISCINPHPTEVIVFTVNLNEIDIGDIHNYLQALSMVFKEYKIVTVPDFISLHSMSKDVLENYITMIQEVIDKLQEDR